MKEGKPSETAVRIAISKVAALQDPELRPLVLDPDEPFSEAFARAHSKEAARQLKMWTNERTRPIAEVLSRSIEPGGPLFVLLRKRFIDEQVVAAVEDGARQLVVLGAGYDLLPLRLMSRYPDLRCFEIDHPPTQEVKRRVLAEKGALSERLALLPVDMVQESYEPGLLAAGFDPGGRSVFLAEAVFMYLSSEEVDRLCAAVRGQAGNGSRFVFTVLNERDLANPASAAYKTAQYLRLSGEPILSGLDPEALGPWLDARGFRLRAQADGRALRAAYLAPLGIDRAVGEGERVVVAETA